MHRKPNLIFVTSLTLKNEVSTPKSIGFLRDIWESYTSWMKLIAVKLFEFSRGSEVSSDGQTDGRAEGWTDKQTAV